MNFTTLTSAQLATMLLKKDFFFVNVHIPYEGEIKNTDTLFRMTRLQIIFINCQLIRTQKLCFYCKSGRMSEIAAKELAQLGYTKYHICQVV